MDIAYKRTPETSHMVIKTAGKKAGFEERMIKENNVYGILSMNRLETDDGLEYWYDISGMRSLRGFFRQEGISILNVDLMLSELSKICESMEAYLLTPNSLLLGPEMIFVKKGEYGYRLFLAYLPGEEQDILYTLQELAGFLIQNVDHSDMRTTKVCYDLYEAINRGETSFKYLMGLCKEPDLPEIFISNEVDTTEKESIERSLKEDSFGSDSFEKDEQEDLFYKPEASGIKRIFKDMGQKMSFGRKKNKELVEIEPEDFDIEEPLEYSKEGETTYLAAGRRSGTKTPALVYLGNEGFKDFLLTGSSFKIGSKNGLEGEIKKSTISRYHAQIYKVAEDYYLEDMESKNGTYINGKIMGFEEKILLKNGDILCFADVEYRFCF